MNRLALQLRFSPPGGFGQDRPGIFNPSNPANNFERLISNIIGVMTVIAALWFIFILMIGAIGWLTAGGDKGAVETARKRIANAITGLVIVTIAIFIASLVGQLVGLDILNISGAITRLTNTP